MEELKMISYLEARKWAFRMAENTSYFWLVVSALWSIIIFAATHNFWLSVFGVGCGLAVIVTVRFLNYGSSLGFRESAPDEDDFEQLE